MPPATAAARTPPAVEIARPNPCTPTSRTAAPFTTSAHGRPSATSRTSAAAAGLNPARRSPFDTETPLPPIRAATAATSKSGRKSSRNTASPRAATASRNPAPSA